MPCAPLANGNRSPETEAPSPLAPHIAVPDDMTEQNPFAGTSRLFQVVIKMLKRFTMLLAVIASFTALLRTRILSRSLRFCRWMAR
ncbi:hypothetical protein ACEQUB_p01159 (plasmid) [Ralstonia syzygii]